MKHALGLAITGAIASMTAMVTIDSAVASSHREAPFITEMPKVDGTDFYMFRSYEEGRSEYVTLIANYLPLQDAYGGPNFFNLDPDALYEIHVDNNADASEDITFQFRFRTSRKNLALPIGGKKTPVPLINIGPIGPSASDTGNLNVIETYTAQIVRGNRRSGRPQAISDANTGQTVFVKPADNIGEKSLPDYATYADQHVYDVNIPGCGNGKMFVGQRKEPFVVNLGEVFDLVNTNPVGPRDGEVNIIDDKNITSLILEIPISCLKSTDPVIGGWTSASLPQVRTLYPESKPFEKGNFVQVSRLGSPLVNELVIGLRDKDRFNGSQPRADARFAGYVTNPTLPALLETLFGVTAPTKFPRSDLVQAFLTGVPGLNQPANVVAAEMLRLNTSIDPAPASKQDSLGVLAKDVAGFPNGRRPGDDVVDIELRVAMGVLLPISDAPSGQLPFTDGAFVDASMFDDHFPYLRDPIPGSPSN